MMEVLHFFFDNFWHFCGLVIILCLIVGIVAAPFHRGD